VPGCASIELDAGLRAVRLPAGVGIDPGGIGKGLAADIVVGELLGAGAAGALVSLGGDVRVAGEPPDGDRWTLVVEHPVTGADLLAVGLVDGAVATSSTLRRRWAVEGGTRHHVVEPTSGRSATGPLVAATAVAGEGWWAEALATAALLGRAPVGTGQVLTVSADGTVTIDPELLAVAA
jgi:thiamine biosynthesis lipoprotein